MVNVFFLQFIVILLSIVIGFRPIDIGTDNASYFKIYSIVNTIPEYISKGEFGWISNTLESGFVWSISILKTLGFDFNSFISIMCFFSFNILLFSFRNIKINNAIIFLVFISTFIFVGSYLNVFRQAIASSFLMVSVSYVCVNKIKKAIICIFLGAFFHVSIVVIIPFILFAHILCRYNFSNNKVVILYFFSIVVAILCVKLTIINYIVSYLPTGGYSNKFTYYLSSSNYSSPILTFSFLLDSLLIMISFYIGKYNSSIRFCAYLYWFLIVIYILISNVGVVAERFYMLSSFIGLYLFLLTLEQVLNKTNANYTYMCVFVLSIIYALKTYLFTATFLS
ncbi:EpsG family protein [Photobacterium phosphoreum]|uniref:EpsG family protein n=1 Tax=Photobacterium phosphoreum TaxID=659 RepID=UPI0039B08738